MNGSTGELNDRQREAVEHDGGHLLVLAGAGSGKTRVLVHRIARLVGTGRTDPHRIVAMTFTNKAAGEMRERVQALLTKDASAVTLGTFHSVCARILRRESGLVGYPSDFSIFDADDQRVILRRILRQNGTAGGITPGSAAAAISAMKNDMKSCEEAEETADSTREQDMASIYSLYERELRGSFAFDFDDLLTWALGVIRHYPDASGRYRGFFTHVLVDEYQDTNLVQRELLMALAGSSTEVTAVGDDDQSIYAWRGARVDNILGFPDDFPGTLTVRLEQNYRSSGNILAAASALVGHNSRRLGKVLWTKSGAGAPVTVQQLPTPSGEARWVLEKAAELVDGGEAEAGSVAVLYRTNAQSREFETASRMAGMPYEVIGTVRFYERAEVKDLVAWLRLVVNPADSSSLSRVINRPPRGVGRKSAELFFGGIPPGSDCIDALVRAGGIGGLPSKTRTALVSLGQSLDSARRLAGAGAGAAEVTDAVIRGTDLLSQYDPGDVQDRARLDNLEEFRRGVSEYDRLVPDGGLPGYLREVSLLSSVDEYSGTGGKLALMTLHCAKGLEFDAVFVTGLEEGMLPFVRPGESSCSDLEEERRLLYVGMTRARKRLFLTFAADRSRPGVRMSGPSRFISEIAGLEHPFGGPAGGSGRAYDGVPGKRSVPVPTAGTARYSRGNLVSHPRYGKGLVVKASRRGDEWELTVDFGFDEPKILLTGYVPIEVVRERGTREDIL
jgi:DNA helicase-2/ATP-dependent DNA helicase PcrA